MEDKPLINRLLSGIVIFKLKDKYVHVKPAKVEDKAFADFYAQEAYEDALLEGILKKEDLLELLIEKGWWTEEEDEKIETLSKNLEQMKVDYHNNFFREESRQYIKKSIKRQLKKLIALHEKKHLFFDKSCEYVKQFAFDALLLEKNAFVDDQPAVNFLKIHSIVYAYYRNTLDDKKIRKTSKQVEWKSLWNASKNFNVFNLNGCELTKEQISLVTWSKFYDSVNESMDRPSDEIIADDLALDGWCILESRKRKEEEKKKKGEGMVSDKMSEAGELFIPVRNQKEQDQVLALNDRYGKSVLRSKAKQFKEGGVKEENLNHVKKELQMEALRKAKENRRR